MVKPSPSDLVRIHPLENQLFAANGVSLKPVKARTRISLRANAYQIESINEKLFIDLPTDPKQSNSVNQRVVMWLGPDEWLILDDAKSGLDNLPAALANIECSIVDISHRNTAIVIKGKRVTDVLNSGCPQDLSLAAFPIGACSRTVLGKSEIILLRLSADKFHVECWRSFSDYVWKYLVEGIKTL